MLLMASRNTPLSTASAQVAVVNFYQTNYKPSSLGRVRAPKPCQEVDRKQLLSTEYESLHVESQARVVRSGSLGFEIVVVFRSIFVVRVGASVYKAQKGNGRNCPSPPDSVLQF